MNPERLRAWWWIARHPFKSLAIRRFIQEHTITEDGHSPDCGCRLTERPAYCCGRCPEIAGGGFDCTCKGNPRCPTPTTTEETT